jgi:hypothetical protein
MFFVFFAFFAYFCFPLSPHGYPGGPAPGLGGGWLVRCLSDWQGDWLAGWSNYNYHYLHD